MTSKVLDLTTIGHALNELCKTYLHDSEWTGINEEQKQFLSWYADHRDEIEQLTNLEALASTDFAELNTFLQTHGFDPLFQPFDGIGVASILDMLVEWANRGIPTIINRLQKADLTDPNQVASMYGTNVTYPAFEIKADGADVYDAVGFEHPLIRLHTKTGHSLWLMKAAEPATGLELNNLTQQLLTTQLTPTLRWTAGVIVPMLEMDLEADMAWMTGMNQGEYFVAAVFQKFKLRANDKGARVKVVTGMVMATSCAPTKARPYVLNDPFIGFFTQPGNDTVALAAFWADTDVWQNPAGTLEEL